MAGRMQGLLPLRFPQFMVVIKGWIDTAGRTTLCGDTMVITSNVAAYDPLLLDLFVCPL